MPLDPDANCGGGIFDGLDDTVGCGRGDLEPFSHLLDRLMMTAVDVETVRTCEAVDHQAGENGVLVDPDLVCEIEGLVWRHGQAMFERPGYLRRDVLNQGSAAGDIQELDATTDTEKRQVAFSRFLNQRDLEGIPLGIDVYDGRMTRFAEKGGINVFTTGQQQTVNAGERVPGIGRWLQYSDLGTHV